MALIRWSGGIEGRVRGLSVHLNGYPTSVPIMHPDSKSCFNNAVQTKLLQGEAKLWLLNESVPYMLPIHIIDLHWDVFII